jgi:hypothetical protein
MDQSRLEACSRVAGQEVPRVLWALCPQESALRPFQRHVCPVHTFTPNSFILSSVY